MALSPGRRCAGGRPFAVFPCDRTAERASRRDMLFRSSPESEPVRTTFLTHSGRGKRLARRVSGVRLRPGGLFSGAVSFVVHLGLILVLAYLGFWDREEGGGLVISVARPADEPQLVLPGAVVAQDAAPGPQEESLGTVIDQLAGPVVPEVFLDPLPGGSEPAAVPRPRRFQPRDLLQPVRTAVRGGGYEGRDPQSRARLVRTRGGTAASEDAMARGLAWLAAHQRRDGSWRFDHRDGACGGMCANPGTHASTTAATGLALLAFLGAGETTPQSQYLSLVERGLYYLVNRMIRGPHGGDLQEGTMYAQGIATIALCEGYALLQDESLREPAQAAVDFIVAAQHEQGGWRYYPGQPGDTTVFGWKIMALNSARLAGLEVPQEVLQRGVAFLDLVQEDDGAYYGYLSAGQSPGPTAIGLLARMYYGWARDDPRLEQGVRYLEELGPSRTDMYFNYYAHQVMHHHEGPGWDAWNGALREHLIATQSRQGHQNGSWYFEDPHAESGGRLYTTAMCVMLLQVYYRYLPLYGSAAVEGPL